MRVSLLRWVLPCIFIWVGKWSVCGLYARLGFLRRILYVIFHNAFTSLWPSHWVSVLCLSGVATLDWVHPFN
jgi:hypothetical protein